MHKYKNDGNNNNVRNLAIFVNDSAHFLATPMNDQRWKVRRPSFFSKEREREKKREEKRRRMGASII
jgi:hypothetical protein